MPIKTADRKIELRTIPFTVESHQVSFSEKPAEHRFYRLKCPDWINVLAVDTENQAILIKQLRYGSESEELETPGGVIDPGEPALDAAKRELEEETGYYSEEWHQLAQINPNPATHTNILHLFLALNAKPLGEKRTRFPDADESIEILKFPLSKLKQTVLEQKMGHALSALCVLWSLNSGLLKQ